MNWHSIWSAQRKAGLQKRREPPPFSSIDAKEPPAVSPQAALPILSIYFISPAPVLQAWPTFPPRA